MGAVATDPVAVPNRGGHGFPEEDPVTATGARATRTGDARSGSAAIGVGAPGSDASSATGRGVDGGPGT